MEKELTTPDLYPVTLNALTTACSQTSNREPVLRYEPNQVETAVLALKSKGLARVVHPGAAERALLCVLLLRGAQTVVELRTRTERLHPFTASDAVEAALDGLARRGVPL